MANQITDAWIVNHSTGTSNASTINAVAALDIQSTT
jgi:hypothetical protein